MKQGFRAALFATIFATLFAALAAAQPLAFAQTAGASTGTLPTRAANPAAVRPSPLPTGILGDIQLTQVRLADAARMLSQVGKTNVVVTGKVAEQIVSLYLRDTTVENMVRNLCRAAGVWYRFDATSKTYVVMSGDEYQKDLAIVRDEQTAVFSLRHHNVVATANALKALFGNRVFLSLPIEEMPPTSLGSGTRTSNNTGNRGTTTTRGAGNRANAGNNGDTGSTFFGGASFDQGPSAGSAGPLGSSRGTAAGAAGSAANYDPASDLGRMSQDRLGGQLRLDANGQPLLGMAEIQDMAGRQGPPVYITYNRLNNLLLVRTGDEQALRQIAELVGQMDKQPRQVLLEMKILEVRLDNGFRSVFDIGFAGTSKSTGPLPAGVLPTTVPDQYARNAGTTGMFDIEQDATMLWQYMSKSLSLRFQLLAQENKLKVLSSPMLVAANNHPARLFIGDERVLTVGASSQSITGTTGATNTQITVETERRDVGQTLSILPRINGDRSVTLTIDQDSSTVRLRDGTIPIATGTGGVVYFPIDTVSTANLQVTAHAQDGMTVAIGGMIRDSLERDEEKVPVLGDIPVLGYLFKRDVRASIRSQIVLLITPRVLESPLEANSVAQVKTQDFNALTATIPSTPVIPTLVNNPPAVPPSAIASGRDGDVAFAGLARAAAAAVRLQDPTAPPPEGLIAVPLNDHGRLSLANGMEARPSASWQRDGLYVTALQVISMSAQPSTLAPTMIPGRWAAMVLESSKLTPAGSAGSWTWAYAISRRPFEQSLGQP